ncbi:hypothetical protein DFH09DRAFT_1303183 [Mycena vulgaris]|nr:hypothetical protein DFH09DRAFT_1303183 [Mycena vulgaris]
MLQVTRSRENLVIITKILCLIRPNVCSRAAFDPSAPNTRNYVNQGGLSRTMIFNQDNAIFVPAADALDLPTIHGTTARRRDPWTPTSRGSSRRYAVHGGAAFPVVPP